jgi:hypothetical protein
MSARRVPPGEPQPPSFDHAASAIVLAIGEPPAIPVGCLALLNICYEVVLRALHFKQRGDQERRFSPARHRPLLAQTMRFLATARTPAQWRSLRDTFASGRCCCEDGPATLYTVSHDPALLRRSNTLQTLVLSMCAVFNQYFRVKLPRVRSPGTRSEPTWPTLDELLPDGAAHSMHALGTWLHLKGYGPGEQSELILVLRGIYQTMPSYTVRGLLKTPSILVWMHRTLARWTPSVETLRPGLLRTRTLGKPLQWLGFFASTVLSYLTDDEMRLWVSGGGPLGLPAADVCTVLCKAIDAVALHPTEDGGAAHDSLAQFGDALSFLAGRIMLVLPDVRLGSHTAQVAIVRQQGVQSQPYQRLRRSAFGKNWDDCCNGPACIATYARRDLDFKRCAGCRTAQYCSRACQRRAWRWPGAAHRDVCEMYEACRAAAQRPGGNRVAGIQEVAEGMTPARLDAVCANLDALQATRHAQLGEYRRVAFCR